MTSSQNVRGRPVRKQGAKRQSGFSLLEVVVAFAILALTLGVLMQIFSRALSTTALSGEYSRAATLAEARLNAVGNEIPLEVGSYSGEPEDGFSWEVAIELYQSGEVGWEPTLDAYLVSATAFWGETGAGSRQVNLITLRLADASAFDERDSESFGTSTRMEPR